MAKTKPAISDDATYRVVLTRSIGVGRAIVHPGPNVKLSGKVLSATIATDAAAVESYELA